ncbi:GGDEF domain-containing protein [Sphingomonas antarctica]|uniref:GGDEF domain-containing protein n=1 Tax=Sphingomonas antarctica TaxID=2040274 RepID=UPI0039EB501D
MAGMLRDVAQSLARPLTDAGRLRAQLAHAEARIAELERLADTDPLTELPNRRPFMRAIARSIRHLERHGTPAAILFIDVDGLKAINDLYGHLSGDAALLHIARVLQREVRASDVVSRIGGDEFGLVLDHVNEEAARAKATALSAAVSDAPVRFGDAAISVKLSIGVATVMQGDTTEHALRRADDEMYVAKRAQRSDK